ncbi:septal ring lytic transglycosylase RlpA family protein [Variovorax sp. DXTD-1]|uniref:septal ring lytic transglycosylase RlpA family protein n=1 Tax=Variovorax sp. DXTD-1 TaxID=2495592 RepID=UPI000F85EED6|nr:septal ring lytic transglycosylase RlpA family protein [Variovorax sp. DXTD-1]RST46141.1 septal ring lytic transglycosylase RlpA family protein [Variovorax sp. DXTD-1]
MAERAGTQAPAALAACAVAVAVLLAGCASGTRSGGGALSGRDGPGTNIPSDLDRVPDAEPRIEAIRSSGGTSKPYTVLGRAYQPITDDRPFRESGIASWYGRKFHSASTASGEPYDMYAMTAAHKTLPLPSYVRVRNPANGREVIVRVNDRGPFVDGRIIDLSYTAALKLDLLRGVAPVEIERITNEDIRTGAWRRDSGTAYAAAPPAPSPPRRAAAASVAVPSAWVAPVAMNAPEASTMPVVPQTPMAPTAPMAQTEEVAQAAPATLEADTAPPPRQPMVVTDLAPMAPLSAPTAPAAAPSAAAPSSAAVAGFWVQLGAFRERDGAESLRNQAARGLPSLAPQLRVFSEAGTHRLQAGPFASRNEAGEAVTQLRDSLRIAPMVVERR